MTRRLGVFYRLDAIDEERQGFAPISRLFFMLPTVGLLSLLWKSDR